MAVLPTTSIAACPKAQRGVLSTNKKLLLFSGKVTVSSAEKDSDTNVLQSRRQGNPCAEEKHVNASSSLTIATSSFTLGGRPQPAGARPHL